ncbi:MAG TPA: type II secretion system F family protein [Acidimicrobiales bacterium]|nr:type II secretion system F family protein [Acidimicrobiales bacterium]
MSGAGLSSAMSVVIAAVALRHAMPGRRRAVHRGAGLSRVPGALRLAAPPPWIASAVRLAAPPPWIASAVRLAAPPPWIASAVADTGIAVDPGRAWSLWLVSLVMVLVAGAAAGGPGAAAVGVGAVAGGPIVAWRLLRRRGSDRLEAALPGAVDAVARALRSGASLRLAIGEAAAATPGPLGAELASVARSIERGASVVAALEAWAALRPSPGVRLVVSALCLGAETGGPLARAVDGVAATLRQRLAARAEARALATQARASAAVLAGAPLAFTAVASLADARTSAFLFRTPAGLLCLAGGLALDAAGALWMARLTRIEVD